MVVTLGNFATKLLLNTETGITRLRGQVHPWWLGSSLVPTFHPAAALRGGDRVTDQMREDFRLVRSILDRHGARSFVTRGEAMRPMRPNWSCSDDRGVLPHRQMTPGPQGEDSPPL